MTANFCTRKDKGDKETDYWPAAELKKVIKQEQDGYIYVTVVAEGTCKKDLLNKPKQDLFKSIILTVVDPDIICEGSCQTLATMSKKGGSLLSLVDRNALNFEPVIGRNDIKAGQVLHQRTFGLYFEGISDAKGIGIDFENVKATGTPSLNKPTNGEVFANGWNFYISMRLKLKVNGKAPGKIRNLAIDRTGLLRV